MMEKLIKERLELINRAKEIVKNTEVSEEEKNVIKEKLIKQFLYEEFVDDYEKPETPIEPELNYIVNTVIDLKKGDYKIGDIVTTKGYYSVDDGGEAKYIIQDYAYYLNEWLPFDCRKIGNELNRLGTDRVLYDSPVDEHGNHTLNNGLVACLFDKEDIKPEQYGAKAEDNYNNLYHFQYMFAHMKHGKITFKSNVTYYLGEPTSNNYPTGMKHHQVPYGVYMGGRGCNCIYPVLANIDGVELIGNNTTLKIMDNRWNSKRYGNDFALLNLFRVIRNLTIHGIIFDNNGLTMDDFHGVENHGISWKQGNLTSSNGFDTLPTVEDGTIHEISNVEIYNCEFKNGGTTKAVNDCGGDGILIINPMENSHDINIHNNKFTNWGRWCFAIDLGGNGECIENVKFNNNTCIQYETNINLARKFRGLGWIDFEARKCFKNLEICNNYVKGCNGFAFNGNDKVSENITIKNNTIIRTFYGLSTAGVYPYMWNFYYVHAKNLVFENNDFSKAPGSNRLGLSYNNVIIRNNKFANSDAMAIKYPVGDIIIDGNERADKQAIASISNFSYPNYFTEEDIINNKTKIIFRNNKGSLNGDLINKSMREVDLIVENNEMNRIDLNYYNSSWSFDVSQLNLESLGNHPFAVGGANIIGSVPYNYRYMPNGGGRYGVGDVITETNTKKTTCIEEGCMPIQGELKYCGGHGNFTANVEKESLYKFIANGNLYVTLNKGTFGDAAPTHTEGIELNGDINVLFLSKVCKYETINKN